MFKHVRRTFLAFGLVLFYMEVAPPSITSSPPVIYEDSSEAKKITPDTISAIVPSLPSGTRLSLSARILGSDMA